MNANDLAQKYRSSPVVRKLLQEDKHIQAIKEVRDFEQCSLVTAREAVLILKGECGTLYTQGELDEILMRNALDRLDMTERERAAFKRKGILK